MRLSHSWRTDGAVFDDENLVSCAGLIPVMALAEQAGLSELLDDHVRFTDERVRSGGANPAGKLTSIIAGLAAGADSIDDLQVVRSGGMKKVFNFVYAPSTLGIHLREFTHGHVRQLDAVLTRHLLALVQGTDLLKGIEVQARVDVDSLLRPVYGHQKQGASFGHTKIANRQVLRKGLSPLAVTISTPDAAPVLAAVRLRAGKAGSGRGAAGIVVQAINPAKKAGATNILVRGDSAYGNGDVINAVIKTGAKFSFVLPKNQSVNQAIATIPDDAWTPVHSPGAVQDPDTGELICRRRSRRNLLHRVRQHQTPCHRPAHPPARERPQPPRRTVPRVAVPPLFHRQHRAGHRRRHHPPATRHRRIGVRRSHRRTLGPPAVGRFSSNAAWTVLAAITHNLLRAAGTLAAPHLGKARGATLRRQIINVPARIARPQGRRILHLPAHWPHADSWKSLWNNTCHHSRQVTA